MIEDKLSTAERIRLESLNQAIQAHAMTRPSVQTILGTAEVFRMYIEGGVVPTMVTRNAVDEVQ